MKRLILFIALLLLLTNCKESKPAKEVKPRFKDGQIAYLKPEFTKVLVITYIDNCFCGDGIKYEISYVDAQGVRQTSTVDEVELSATKE